MTCPTNGQQRLIIVLHTSVQPVVKCEGMQNLIEIYHVIQELWAYDRDLSDISLASPCHLFASIISVSTMFKCISMQNFIKMYGTVHELWAFSRKDLDQPKWCSLSLITTLHTSDLTMVKQINRLNLTQIYHAVKKLWTLLLTDHNWLMLLSKPSSSKKAVTITSGKIMLICICIQNVIKICHVVQEWWAFSQSANRRMYGWADGRLKWCSAKPRHHFAYQYLDNVKIDKYAIFNPNIPCGSWVMSIFTN